MKGVYTSGHLMRTHESASGMYGRQAWRGLGKSGQSTVMWEGTSVAKRPYEELGRNLHFGLHWNFHGPSNVGLGGVTRFKIR